MDYQGVTEVIAKSLLELKERIEYAKIPPSKIDETVNIATWNVREFGKKPRTKAALFYIAEILSQFDLIGLVEVRDDVSDLKKVLDILGPEWRAAYSDAILDAGKSRANRVSLRSARSHVQRPRRGSAATAREDRHR